MKQLLRLMLLVTVVSVLVACTAAPAPEATGNVDTAPAADGVDRSKLAKELYFYNWTDYVDPQILADFEAEYGVKVILDTYDANEDMIAKVAAGGSGYDIAVPSDYAVQTMVNAGLVQELDLSLIPNLVHIEPTLLNKYFDEGNKYSVPYMYGISGIAYNKSVFTATPDSWAMIFEPANIEQYAGKFSMLDDERESPGAALRYLGKSLNETDPEALAQAQAILTAQKQYLAAYNSSDVNRKMSSGEYVMAHAWSGAAMQARNGLEGEFEGNPDIGFFIPKEGGMIWMDNMVILKDSPNAYTAHVFMNFVTRPAVSAQNTSYIGYLTPNKDAVPLLDQTVRDLYAEGFAPDAEVSKRLEWAVRNDETAIFSDVWTAVKGE
ncbi:MAG: spermidine/putrescine ABC transporter substrate-binding protein [Roseiflexaceae bacterium]|jgi:spermidine/putrescine transport system substrate-binding protein|nr:spermidine/putrescine ABC transporter substrate-binding protein [Chloroflexaceae bacterium]MCE2854016.1 spermidine/putrescine ABC transporter substrate-binding protein [Chloroflexaceae bacterium]